MRTRAVEDYVKAIWRGERDGRAATTSSVARAVGVSAPSATVMLRRLGEMGLVRYRRYHGVALTAEGRELAVRLVRSHRLIESFLSRVLGVPWDRVHEEAERWEHVVSQDVVERMDEALGHPEFDVHGHAIPRSDGTVATGKGGVELRDLAPGTPARVLEVADRDPSLLREVSAAGLVPGALVQVSRTPAAGAKVAVAVGGRRLRLGWEAAGAVRTRPIAGERLP